MNQRNTPPLALIVEDEPASQHLLKVALERHGMSTVLAKNGAEGLYHFLRNSFDVAIVDIMMPIVGGEDFLKVVELLHKNGIHPARSKIIIYSAVSNFEQLRQYSSYECVQSVLRKPAGIHPIIEAVKTIVSGGTVAPQPSAH